MNNQDKIHVVSRAVIIDQEHILVCKTLDLEFTFYFLPGGHIDHGESAEVSLLRELKEETGVDCTIGRFLGCLEYKFEPGHSSICHNHEYNLIFEASSSELNFNKTVNSLEPHIELMWHPLDALSEIDFRAEPLVDLLPVWLNEAETLRFRSVMA